MRQSARAADGYTVAIPHCVECPPLREQTDRALATGACCKCGGPIPGTGLQAVREIAARKLLRRIG